MSTIRITAIIFAVLAGYILLVFAAMGWVENKSVVAASSIVANLGLIMAMVGLMLHFREYNQTLRNREKAHFVDMTARFADIQRIFIENNNLEHLFAEIYRADKDQATRECSVTLSDAELAVCSIMFQLMEDVWTIHELTPDNCPDSYSGWMKLFAGWLRSNRVEVAWNRLNAIYGNGFRTFVTEMRTREQPQRQAPTTEVGSNKLPK